VSWVGRIVVTGAATTGAAELLPDATGRATEEWPRRVRGGAIPSVI
jgi:hypothetical protein